MTIQFFINIVKDRLVSGLSHTDPALNLLAERLDEAPCFIEVGGDPSVEKPQEQVSMPALIHLHGRIETAMICMVVENMGPAIFFSNHGVWGRTLPLLSRRAMITFNTTYDPRQLPRQISLRP